MKLEETLILKFSFYILAVLRTLLCQHCSRASCFYFQDVQFASLFAIYSCLGVVIYFCTSHLTNYVNYCFNSYLFVVIQCNLFFVYGVDLYIQLFFSVISI